MLMGLSFHDETSMAETAETLRFGSIGRLDQQMRDSDYIEIEGFGSNIVDQDKNHIDVTEQLASHDLAFHGELS